MVDVQRREDALLDTIHELVMKRNSALNQLEAWKLAAPELTPVIEDVELLLR